MSWRKRMKWRLDWLTNDHLELSYCTICWATVWIPHKRLHQQWHEVRGDVGSANLSNQAGTTIALNQWDRLDGMGDA